MCLNDRICVLESQMFVGLALNSRKVGVGHVEFVCRHLNFCHGGSYPALCTYFFLNPVQNYSSPAIHSSKITVK